MSYSACPKGARSLADLRAVCLIVFVGVILLFDFTLSARLRNAVDSPVEAANSIFSEVPEKVRDEEVHSGESGTLAESVCRDFGYPVRTRLEIRNGAVKWRDGLPPVARFRRRADKATLGRDGSSRDYMSSYYAQRKAIMDKYNSQQKEISERLERTKNLIAAKQRLRGSKVKVPTENENATRGRDRDVSPPTVTRSADPDPDPDNPTTEPNPSSPFDFERDENDSSVRRPEVSTFDSTAFNVTASDVFDATVRPIAEEGWTPRSSNPAGVVAVENSTEPNPPPVESSSRVYTTVRSFENNDVGDGERSGENPEVNFLPYDEVDLNFTEETPASPGNDNETLIIDLGGRLTDHHPWRNDSASAELDKMFLWNVETGEGRLHRSNGSAPAREVEAPLESANSMVANASGSSVRVESSPGIHVTKSVKNTQSSTTTYRNLTHEIIEVDGVVTEVKRIDDVPSAGVGRQAVDGNASAPGEVYGGAQESEWCEDCPHDYRWGECEGTLFYQHNIFLRNRGPSAIDAVFGMEVQGPVDVTCVEALRFNETRGIVTLHSGGPGHAFAKLRIRGFQGEGFSYIMKVWGVNSGDHAGGTTNHYP